MFRMQPIAGKNHNPRSYRGGFSLIELLITLAIMIILGAIGLIILSGKRSTADIDNAATQIVGLLREAQSNSISQAQSAGWGVHLENSTGTQPFFSLFKGSYTPSGAQSHYSLPPTVAYYTSSIAAGSATDVSFSQINGTIPATKTIVLVLKSNPSVARVIVISAYGVISVVRANVPVFVASVHNVDNGSCVIKTNGNKSGDLMLVAVAIDVNTSIIPIGNPTDQAGNTYALALGPYLVSTGGGTGEQMQIWYAKNIKSYSGTNKITVPTGGWLGECGAMEYSGFDTVAPFDSATAASSTGSALSSGFVMTHATSEIAIGFGVMGSNGRPLVAGAGFNPELVYDGGEALLEDQYIFDSGNYAATEGAAGSDNWLMGIVTLKTKP